MPCPSCGRPGLDSICPTCVSHQKDMAARAQVVGEGQVLYYENSHIVGTRQVAVGAVSPSSGVFNSSFLPNTAYFCPICGEVWAREIYTFKFAYRPIPKHSWVVEQRACPEHGDGYLLVGKDLDSCSIDILRREVQLIFLHNPVFKPR